MSNNKPSAMIERNKQMYWPVEWKEFEGEYCVERCDSPLGMVDIVRGESGSGFQVYFCSGGKLCDGFKTVQEAKDYVQSRVNKHVDFVLDGLVVA